MLNLTSNKLGMNLNSLFQKARTNFRYTFLAIFWFLILWWSWFYVYYEFFTDESFIEIVKDKREEYVPSLADWVFKVESANFDFGQRKIPYDVWKLEFVFSENLDPESVNQDTFEIQPYLTGDLSVKDNIITYNLSGDMKEWQFYDVYITDWIRSHDDRTLQSTLNYSLEAVQWVEITSFVPEWDLRTFSQNFIAIFNIPVVPLTNLDARDELHCPFEISPSIEGRCDWATTSVVEFIPDESLKWATDYKVKIDATDELVYPLTESYEYEVNTPDLQVYLPRNSFSPSNGMNIRTNYPVELEELKSKISLYFENSSGLELDFSLESTNDSKTRFNLQVDWVIDEYDDFDPDNPPLSHNEFYYWKDYYINVDSGLPPKYWNRDTSQSFSSSLTSSDFLTSFSAHKSIYSWDELLDTNRLSEITHYKYWDKSVLLVPVSDTFYELNFDQEVDLDKNLYKLYDQDWNEYDYNIEYFQKEEDWDELDNKKRVKITPVHDFPNDKKFFVEISDDIHTNQNKVTTKSFKTPEDLELTRYEYVSYTKSCVYFNNRINYSDNDWAISYSPDAIIRNISDGQNIPWNLREASDQELIDNGYCPRAKEWESLWVINSRLNPDSVYELSLEWWIVDYYNNVLDEWFSWDVETESIRNEDMFIYSSVSKDENIFPSYEPLVVNLQSINMDQIDMEVCEMDFDWYLHYLQNRNTIRSTRETYSPNCVSTTTKTLDLDNYHWDLSNNKFDLQEDILEREFNENFVLVRSNVPWYDTGRSSWKSFTDLYIRSNLSLTLEDWWNKSILFATDFKWEEIISDLDFQFYERDRNSHLWYSQIDREVVFNEEKWAYEMYDSFDLAIASNDDYFTILNKTDDRLSNHDFSYLGWTTTSQTHFLYLYTDRPIYKPWDKVQLKWLLRDFTFDGYQASKFQTWTVKVHDSQRSKVNEFEVQIDGNSNFTWEFTLPDDPALGRYTFRFEPDSESIQSIPNDASFSIEEYQPETFQINTESEKDNFTLWEKVNIQVKPEYYFGASMTDTVWNVRVMKQNYFFDAKDYSFYQFGEWYWYFSCHYWGNCQYDDDLVEKIEFEIDESWVYDFEYEFPSDLDEWEQIYNFIFEVTDPDTQRQVNKTVSKVLHNTDWYVWIQTSYFNTKDWWIDFDWVVLDNNANEKANSQVKLELIKREWKSVRKQWVDWVYYNDFSLHEEIEQDIEISSDNKWEFKHIFDPESTWQYRIKATYTWSNWKSFSSSSNVFVSGGDYVSWRQWNNDVVDFAADEMMADVWDTHELVLQSPVDNWKALIVIMQDDNILDYFVHEINSFGEVIQIDVKENYYPNFYTRAFLIWEETDNPLPKYARAMINTKVDIEHKRLNIDVQAQEENYNPQDNVVLDIQATDIDWNPVSNVNGSIAVVDKSVLALVGNPQKNPFAFFYEMTRYLGVTAYSSIKNIVDKLEIKDPSDWKKWWDGDDIKWSDSDKERWEFRDTAFWIWNFETNEDGFKQITTDNLPDNLTTWNVEVIASKTDWNKIWIWSTTFRTSKNVMVSPNLPVFLSSDDEIVFSPVIFNRSWQDQEFEVGFEWSLMEVFDDSKKVFIENEGSKTVNFRAQVKEIWILPDNNKPSSQIRISARWKENDESDIVVKHLKIYESSTPEAVATVWQTDQRSFDERIYVWQIMENRAVLDIKYAPSLISSLIDSFDRLFTSEYSSISNQIWSLIPNVLLKFLYESANEELDLTKETVNVWRWDRRWYEEIPVSDHIYSVLASLKNFQKNNWWFVRWQDFVSRSNIYANFSLTSNIVYNLWYIKKAWFHTDEKVINDAISYLKNEFETNRRPGCTVTQYNDCTYSEYQRLSAIKAILSYSPDDYDAFNMWKTVDKTNSSIRFQLLNWEVIAYLLDSDLEISNEEKQVLQDDLDEIVRDILANEVVFNPRWAYIWRASTRNRISNTSRFINIISKVGVDEYSDIQPIIDNIIRWMMSQKDEEWSFGSLNNTLTVVQSFTSYLESTEELQDLDMDVEMMINSEKVSEMTFDDDNKFSYHEERVQISDIQEKNIFNISKIWDGRVYYDLSLKYYMPSENIDPRDQWFTVDFKYFDYDEYEKIKAKKDQEYAKYQDWDISYDDLEYPRSVFEYIDPVDNANVGDLLITKYKIINNETRDEVVFDSFIPSGAQLLNPNLETQKWAYAGFETNLFDIQEYRSERFFGYKNTLYPWVHTGFYVIRVTHEWEFNIRPSIAFEFENEEVFGRSAGKFIEFMRD